MHRNYYLGSYHMGLLLISNRKLNDLSRLIVKAHSYHCMQTAKSVVKMQKPLLHQELSILSTVSLQMPKGLSLLCDMS